MKLRIAKVHETAPRRPPGYVEDVISRGVTVGEWLEIEPEPYRELLEKYRPEPSLPSMGKMMLNAFTAAAQEVKARAMMESPLPTGEVARRLEICETCEFFIPTQGRCSKCGCFMNFKARLRSQHCPVGKW